MIALVESTALYSKAKVVDVDPGSRVNFLIQKSTCMIPKGQASLRIRKSLLLFLLKYISFSGISASAFRFSSDLSLGIAA